MLYKNDHLHEISFPLGGIGTGSVGLSGTGRLIDWEIFNRPNKGSVNGYSHFAVRADWADNTSARVLCGDTETHLAGVYRKSEFTGFGFGAESGTMSGFPHFSKCTFEGTFPLAKLTFADNAFPGAVELSAFNPFIPGDADNSSLPAAFFAVTFRNPLDVPVKYTGVFSVAGPFADTRNEDVSDAAMAAVRLVHAGVDTEDREYGDLTVACLGEDAKRQVYWYRGAWRDGVVSYWNEFSGAGFTDRQYDTAGKKDTASVWRSVTLMPGESCTVRFLLTWNVPNCYNYWNDPEKSAWKNYYATKFSDSAHTARYCAAHFASLYARTEAFRDALFATTLDEAVLDAVSSTLSVLKSPTVLRLTDGTFWGWEGVNELTGSCEGTCQHVWTYAYAMCFLFPDLERSVRDMEMRRMEENGRTHFRLSLPEGLAMEDPYPACLDGQMGTVIKMFREWRIFGDDGWLRGHWEKIKKLIAYAWHEENPGAWDRDRDGVLEGRQHHTLDMEMFGPSAWLQSMYLCALRAGEEMALYLGDGETASEYRRLFEGGYAFCRDHLFNGKWFTQRVDLSDDGVFLRGEDGEKLRSEYWNEEASQLKYQIGDGCEIDQLLGQWHADICGLGRLFDEKQMETALDSLYKNNFKPSLREFVNPWRVFALNDEGGAIMCDYPADAEKPAIPLPYCEECMTGFEYSLGGLLMAEGHFDEGLSLVRAVRDRYDGKKRNPYNELECGSNYARAMASFAILPLMSGFVFDMPRKTVGFQPRVKGDFCSFWSLGCAFGTVSFTGEKITLSVSEGTLTLGRYILPEGADAVSLVADGVNVPFRQEENALVFEPVSVTGCLTVLRKK